MISIGKKRYQFMLISLLLAVLASLVIYAPTYLTYADHPVRSDVVILFIGPDYPSRMKEARRLIQEGYADQLFVPANGKKYRALRQEALVTLEPVPGDIGKKVWKQSKSPSRFQEETHWEAIKAKAMMDESGLKSAILVSSPYHMRRIKLIAGIIMNSSRYDLCYVPTRYESAGNGWWWISKFDLKWITSEYAKMIWFLSYYPFS
jgi:hypothetical protein